MKKTHAKAASLRAVPSPRPPEEVRLDQVLRARAELGEALDSLLYLARNMHEAFDGDVGPEAANAMAAFVSTQGHLLSVREVLDQLSDHGMDELSGSNS